MKKHWVVIVVLAVMTIGQVSHGRLILQQDFDNIAVFPDETSMTSPGLGDSTSTGGIWYRYGGGTDPRPTTAQAYSGTQSVRISSSGGGLMGVRSNDFVNTSADTGILAEFWLYRIAGSGVEFYLSNDAANGPFANALLIQTDGVLKARNYGDNGWEATNQQAVVVPVGQWVGFKVEVDLTQPYSNRKVYYNNGTGYVLAGIHSINPTKQSHADEVSFWATGTVYMDNLKFEAVPEPASMLLFASCVGVYFTRRKSS